MTPHWDAVPPAVAALYRTATEASGGADFYLAGGTALALQLGHRVSLDLDFFSPSFREVEPLAQALQAAAPGLAVTLTARRTLYTELDGVQASFFGYDYPLLAPLLRPEPGLLPIADPDDIAAMKLAALASRGSRKDFVDLWVLVHRQRPLRDYLALFQRKYGARDVGHVVRSLVYFADADLEPPLKLLVDAPWPRVKTDFQAWALALFDE